MSCFAQDVTLCNLIVLIVDIKWQGNLLTIHCAHGSCKAKITRKDQSSDNLRVRLQETASIELAESVLLMEHKATLSVMQ